MSLAMFAAPFDDTGFQTNNVSTTHSPLEKYKKRNSMAKTQRKNPNFSDKVNSVLQTMHNLPEEHENSLSNYEPLTPPTSAKIESKPYSSELLHDELDKAPSAGPSPSNFLSIQNNNPIGKSNMYLEHQSNNNSYEDPIMAKLNYMTSLLEQNQDERTSNVFEEVILYSFLGIFVIFIVDSFTRVGKYVR
jgi:hypothetical protein